MGGGTRLARERVRQGRKAGKGGEGDLEVCHIRCPAGVTWSPAPTIKVRSAHVEVRLLAPQSVAGVAPRKLCDVVFLKGCDA